MHGMHARAHTHRGVKVVVHKPVRVAVHASQAQALVLGRGHTGRRGPRLLHVLRAHAVVEGPGPLDTVANLQGYQAVHVRCEGLQLGGTNAMGAVEHHTATGGRSGVYPLPKFAVAPTV